VRRRVISLKRRDAAAGGPKVEAPPPDGDEAGRRWNLWELEQVARESGNQDPARDEERALLLLTLRQFAASSGALPSEFDPLVRDVFGSALSQTGPPMRG
jgi:hypothetical protein